MWTVDRSYQCAGLLLTLSLLMGAAEGFVTTPAGCNAAKKIAPCIARPGVGKAVSHRGLGIGTTLRASAAEWTEACSKAGLTLQSKGSQQLPAEDVATLLVSAMAGEPRRKDTFAEVGGGAGLAMATACEKYDFGQAALLVREEDVGAAEKALEASMKMSSAFDRCQITPGNVQDMASGSRLLAYFDVIFADTRGDEWGSNDASTLSAATGQNCLEGSRVVTVGRKLVNEEGVWEFKLLETVPLSCKSEGFVWEVVRSAKSSPPDAKPSGDEKELEKGQFCKVKGVVKTPELNGEDVVVLDVDEEGVYTVMLDVSCQTFRIRRKNLEPYDDEEF